MGKAASRTAKRFLPLVVALVAVGAGAGPSAAAPSEAQRCLAAKLKAVGKYDLCIFKAQAKAALDGMAADTAKCDSKFTEKWTKPDTKFGADCPDAGAPTVAEEVDEHVQAVLDLLGEDTASCGDGQIDVGEDCDGAALNGQTCTSLGFSGGTLTCDNSCDFDTSACTMDPCDPLIQDCAVNEGCYAEEAVGDSACYPAGTKTDGQACTLVNDCVPGHMCVSLDFMKLCRQVCTEETQDLECPGSQECAAEPLGEGAGICF